MEILFSLLYALFIGLYNTFKKLSLKRSNETSILLIFTTVAFFLSFVWIPFGVAIPLKFVPIFALKGFLLALSWYLILKVLKDVDLSAVTVTNVLSAVLSFVLGLVIFKESTTIWQIVGSVIVVLGVAGINMLNKTSKGKLQVKHFLLLLVSVIITSTSNVIDKYTTTYLSACQVQFWFLLFVVVFSWIFFAIDCLRRKEFLIKKHDFKNFWIYLVGIFLFVGDMMLFFAYRVRGSKMITINVIAKLKVIVPVLMGILVFKEKNVLAKIMITLTIILGVILISVSG